MSDIGQKNEEASAEKPGEEFQRIQLSHIYHKAGVMPFEDIVRETRKASSGENPAVLWLFPRESPRSKKIDFPPPAECLLLLHP
ncbi:MAG: hypothetical protein H0W43_12475 [Chthoniobacterales bacterium]|nr:hypothetical protein [Chthoniobacterales bacterium]